MPQFTTENVCYVKHGERQIMARVFKLEGAGPSRYTTWMAAPGKMATSPTDRARRIPGNARHGHGDLEFPPCRGLAIQPRSRTSITASAGRRRTPRS